MIVVDERWTGNHGIARYAKEVIGRLTIPRVRLPLTRNPAFPVQIPSWPAGQRLGKADLLYSPGYNPLLTRRKQVITVHDLIHLHSSTQNNMKFQAYYDLYIKPMIRRNKVVLTVSETSKSLITEWLNDESVSVVNAGNGCSEVFSPQGSAHTKASPYFLYVGNAKSHKNFGTLLRAMDCLPDFSLIAVGPSMEDVHQLHPKMNRISSVETMRGISDVRLAEIYRGAVATIVPSTIEGFGLPAAESLRSGIPVVYWEGCHSVAEICANAGYAVPDALDPLGWVNAMESAASAGPSSLGADIDTRYDWNSVASRVSKTLNEHCH